MDQTTTNLKLPYIAPSQAQKHVTHNEAIRALDALVQLSVMSRKLKNAPPEPSEGDRYIVRPRPSCHGRGRRTRSPHGKMMRGRSSSRGRAGTSGLPMTDLRRFQSQFLEQGNERNQPGQF